MKFRYHIIIGGNPFRHPFQVERLHFSDNKYLYSGHGKSCRNIEQAHKWIIKDMSTLNKDDEVDVMVLKCQHA